ncbi:AI-2E family transporter [Leifsonia aquatica]|uniref:AI-2E family transporter n=1 Tax=Leifsonia aquatica TaxID=144185 RepID=UPI0028B19D12|nr:AI-2E family transporter [Leifsonia aquatica]
MRDVALRRQRAASDAKRTQLAGLPTKPFRYAFIATLGVGAGVAVLGALSSLATVLTYVGLALFLSAAVDPALRFVTAKGMRRGVAATILAIVGLLVVAALGFAVIPSATEQLVIAAERLVSFAQTIPDQGWFVWLVSNLPSSFDISQVLTDVISVVSDPQQLLGLAGGLLQVGNGIVGGVTGVIVVAILTLYFVVTLPQVKAKAYEFVPMSTRGVVADLSNDIVDSVGRYVGGQLALAAINAVFTFVLVSLVGSPAPMLLAVVAFIGALIPVVGTVFGAAIAVLVTLTVNPVGAVVVAVVMLVYMQVEAYVLSPRVMARAVAVPGALVIVAALGGAALGGILGALVAVPAAAAGLTIVNRVVLPAQSRR